MVRGLSWEGGVWVWWGGGWAGWTFGIAGLAWVVVGILPPPQPTRTTFAAASLHPANRLAVPAQLAPQAAGATRRSSREA